MQFLLENGIICTFWYKVTCKKFSWSGRRGQHHGDIGLALNGTPISELRSVTCRMGSHTVHYQHLSETCQNHPISVASWRLKYSIKHGVNQHVCDSFLLLELANTKYRTELKWTEQCYHLTHVNPSLAGTRFTYPGGMESWVDWVNGNSFRVYWWLFVVSAVL